MIQYALISIVRPEILERTLQSFKDNVQNNKMDIAKCYVNIDPNPIDIRVDQQIKVLQKYFAKENLIINISNQSNFPQAVKWVYSNIGYEQYSFFLEDDWILTNQINLYDIINLCKDPVHSVNIRAYKNSNKFYQAHTLHKTSFLKYLAKNMTFSKNPQVEARQFDNNSMNYMQYPEEVILKDIGRQYQRQNKLQRNSRDPAKFIRTVKQEDIIKRIKNE